MAKNDDQKNQQLNNEGGNVDQIRDILFGGQMRAYEQRFDQIEERLNADMKRMHKDMDKRLSSIEDGLLKRLDQIEQRVQKQREDNNEVRSKLEKQLQEMEDRINQSSSQIQDELKNYNKDMRESLRSQRDELREAMDKSQKRLDDDKPARTELANLFSEFALRINKEFDLPASE